MTEFNHGDRVMYSVESVKRWMEENGTADAVVFVGTVVDETLLERRGLRIFGSFEECLPLPVAVRWDDFGSVRWEPGDELELVGRDGRT